MFALFVWVNQLVRPDKQINDDLISEVGPSEMYEGIETTCLERKNSEEFKMIEIDTYEKISQINQKNIEDSKNNQSQEIKKADPLLTEEKQNQKTPQTQKQNKFDSAQRSKKIDFDYSKAKYQQVKLLGKGAFSVVYQAFVPETQEIVAIKQLLQDKRYKNRETKILQNLNHQNIVQMKACYNTLGQNKEDVWINIVMEIMPSSLHEYIYKFSSQNFIRKKQIPNLKVKIIIYQLLRGLAYLKSKQISHRDLKPQNILFDEEKLILKICDFGSAKKIAPQESSISYIGSRFYRAPELILGAQIYNEKVDVWAVGCIFAEIMLGRPVFMARENSELFYEISKILGTPSRQDITDMQVNFEIENLMVIQPIQLENHFDESYEQDGFELLAQLLKWSPRDRILPWEALCDKYFDEIRYLYKNNFKKLNLSDLFNFSEDELQSMTVEQRKKLIVKQLVVD